MIPPRKSVAFVWRMEEVLDLYEEPYDPLRPVVCFDERPCQLVGDVRDPLPMKPRCIERFDPEYERGGVCWVLMSFEPLDGWRELVVTERRRRGKEFAHSMRRLVEERLSAGREDPDSVGQPLNAHGRRLLRELLGGGCPQVGSEDRVCLHAGAWLVTEHGGGGDLCFGEAVPQAKIAGYGDAGAGGARVVQEAQPVGCECGLALQDRGCAHQAPQSLPISEKVTED